MKENVDFTTIKLECCPRKHSKWKFPVFRRESKNAKNCRSSVIEPSTMRTSVQATNHLYMTAAGWST